MRLRDKVRQLKRRIESLECERDDLISSNECLWEEISDLETDCDSAEERTPPWISGLLDLWRARSSALDRDDLISLIRARSPEAAELLETILEHE